MACRCFISAFQRCMFLRSYAMTSEAAVSYWVCQKSNGGWLVYEEIPMTQWVGEGEVWVYIYIVKPRQQSAATVSGGITMKPSSVVKGNPTQWHQSFSLHCVALLSTLLCLFNSFGISVPASCRWISRYSTFLSVSRFFLCNLNVFLFFVI